MLMLLLNLCLGQTPNATIVVSDSRYEEIYVDKVELVTINKEDQDYDHQLFVHMNVKKHLAGKDRISGIYNHTNSEFMGSDCDYKREPLKCSSENSTWTLKTYITEGEDQATLSMLLFDESGVVIASTSRSKYKKIQLIQNTTITKNQGSSSPVTVLDRACSDNTCLTIPRSVGGNVGAQVVTEERPPTRVTVSPRIRDGDIAQAVMGLYLSIDK